MNDIKFTINDHIINGNLEKALEMAGQYLSGPNEDIEDITLLKSQHSNLTKKIIEGTILDSDATIQRNRIATGLVKVLKKWNPSGQKDQLRLAIESLLIDPDEEINEFHLFNCNRQQPRRHFRRNFDANNEVSRRFQFYFICADRREKPDSLARGLFCDQIIREEIGEFNSKIVNFVHTDEPGRIKPEKLPLGSNLTKSIQRFKEYVQQRFRFPDYQSFEVFLEKGIPKLHYQYVVSIFDLNESEWEDKKDWHAQNGSEKRQYFDWIINQFQCSQTEIPTFIFFFVIYIQNHHDKEKLKPQQKEILKELEVLVNFHESAILKELNPVDENDLTNWLSGIGERDPNTSRKVIKALIQNLDPEDQKLYYEQNRIHMKDIEIVQRIVYQQAKK